MGQLISERSELKDRKCPQCGRVFCTFGDRWAYKKVSNKQETYFCRYDCKRSYERQNPTIEEKIDQAIRDGLNDYEIHKYLGAKWNTITERRSIIGYERKTGGKRGSKAE